MRFRLTCLFAGMAALACGQPGSVAGPSTGYVFAPDAKTVRQVRGIPGAALLGDPVDFGMPIARAEISARGDFAAAIAADGTLHLFRLGNGTAKEVTADHAMAAADRIVFSPSGTALVLYGGGQLQVLSGLPDGIAAGSAQSVAAASPRTSVGALAVSDDGAYVLMRRGSSVLVISQPGSERVLTESGSLASVAFAPDSHDAAVVSGGTLSVFQDVAGPSTRQDFPNASTGAVAFSANGSKIVMAGPRALTVLSRATGEATRATCECQISGLNQMGALFRLNDPGAQPMWLLDLATDDPRLVFVPATQ